MNIYSFERGPMSIQETRRTYRPSYGYIMEGSIDGKSFEIFRAEGKVDFSEYNMDMTSREFRLARAVFIHMVGI